ncbi:MAG TPA: transcriptional repressor [Acetobacteraceae bacterium]|nr:transcriptional repressor [Acetobacteraceae bacterium]
MSEAAFAPQTTELLARAAQLCHQRGARLTDLRRQVLGLILDAEGPVGAYELLDRLRAHRRAAAPPTVYRSLEFLQEQGLVHRIERLAAFVGCIESEPHAHAAQFLICRRCGRVTEMDDHALGDALAAAARRVGFAVSGATVEAEGVCAGCAAGQGAAAR